MAFEYKPDNYHRIPIDPLRCKAYVSNTGRMMGGHQCRKKAKEDGWCSIHSPGAQEERNRKAEERYKRERENSVSARLGRARNRIKELKAIIRLAEWIYDSTHADRHCPWCMGTEPNHNEGCEIGEL